MTDVLISGVHERGTSHYELMRAFVPDALLERAEGTMERSGFRHHEFGDAVWIARAEAEPVEVPVLTTGAATTAIPGK